MKIGFIGNGNMGGAIVNGIISQNIASGEDIIVSDINEAALKATSDKYGVMVTTDNKVAAKEADMLFLAVKPNILYKVIEEIKDSVNEEALVISIVAGQSIKKIQNAFGKPVKLVRVMPNTPAFVGEAMSGISITGEVSKEGTDSVLSVFNSIGRAEVVPEKLMDAVTAVSGSAPAYVFMLIEAMADAAVMGGMPRDKAYTFAAQAVLGSAKMVLETDIHPGKLKDMVCSPGGTTIEAVAVLEEEGMRNAIIKAMKACMDKSSNM